MKIKLKGLEEIPIDVNKMQIAIVDGILFVFNELGEKILQHSLASPQEVLIKI
jgi:hypothetical protein